MPGDHEEPQFNGRAYSLISGNSLTVTKEFFRKGYNYIVSCQVEKSDGLKKGSAVEVFKTERGAIMKNVVVTVEQKKQIVVLVTFDVCIVGLMMLASFLDYKKMLYFPGELNK